VMGLRVNPGRPEIAPASEEDRNVRPRLGVSRPSSLEWRGRVAWKRRTAGGLGAMIALGAISTGVVLGAVQRATLTPQEAPSGASVTIHVETTSRQEGIRPGTLIMVPAGALDVRGASASQCDEHAGSAAVSEMTWETGLVAFGDGVYDGFIGDATFIVPAVLPGSYQLGENVAFIGTGCHIFARFEVTSGQLPDTAMALPDADTLAAALLTVLLVTGSLVVRSISQPGSGIEMGTIRTDSFS
jgi:hypothetical protein